MPIPMRTLINRVECKPVVRNEDGWTFVPVDRPNEPFTLNWAEIEEQHIAFMPDLQWLLDGGPQGQDFPGLADFLAMSAGPDLQTPDNNKPAHPANKKGR